MASWCTTHLLCPRTRPPPFFFFLTVAAVGGLTQDCPSLYLYLLPADLYTFHQLPNKEKKREEGHEQAWEAGEEEEEVTTAASTVEFKLPPLTRASFLLLSFCPLFFADHHLNQVGSFLGRRKKYNFLAPPPPTTFSHLFSPGTAASFLLPPLCCDGSLSLSLLLLIETAIHTNYVGIGRSPLRLSPLPLSPPPAASFPEHQPMYLPPSFFFFRSTTSARSRAQLYCTNTSCSTYDVVLEPWRDAVCVTVQHQQRCLESRRYDKDAVMAS